MKKVYIWTDGSCSGNPGPGAWGAILQYKNNERIISGGLDQTTNNRMELRSVVEALSTLKENCDVTIFSDSIYVINNVTKGHLYTWIKNGWITKRGTNVKHQDLWERMIPLLNQHNVTFRHVRGHKGDPMNARIDEIVRSKVKYRNY